MTILMFLCDGCQNEHILGDIHLPHNLKGIHPNLANMKTGILALLFFISIFIISCGGGNGENESAASNENSSATGEVKPGDVKLTSPLNAEWVTDGKGIYDLKCQSCHKLTDERLVGPGWKNVTKRREPHWILNMVTNVDMMLEKDPEAQKLLEQCLVRMPNQNLTLDQARHVLEFMRSNDGEK